MRRLVLSAVLAAAMLAPAAAAASDEVAGVRVGMTKAEVLALLGPPADVKHVPSSWGRVLRLAYPARRLYVRLPRTSAQGRGVLQVETHDPGEWVRALHVGSSLGQVRAGLRGETCGGRVHRWCFVGSPAQRTIYYLERRRVERIVLTEVVNVL